MSHRTLFLEMGNDSNLRLAGLRNVLSGTLVTSADVVFTIVVSGTATQVFGQSWPSSMTLVNTETALWVGPLINSMVLTQDQCYQALVTATAGIGHLGFWRLPIKAIVREE